jgi:hypothetical protein
MVARLVECSDWDILYGILIVENVDINTVQDKIYQIKKKFYDQEFDDWTLDDVFAEFPKEWEWKFQRTDYDEALEI